MTDRSYGQYCGLAHALDLVGQRWSLLILRELLTGPKRYKALLQRLPGIGTNLLAKRLKALEARDLIARQRLPPPASTDAYVLTDLGGALEPVIVGLARWGYRSLPPPTPGATHVAEWALLAMKAVFRADQAQGVMDEYEYHVDDAIFHVRIKNGHLTTHEGPTPYPDLMLETDAETFLALVSSTLSMTEALRQGRLRATGDDEAFARNQHLLDFAPLHGPPPEPLPTLDLTGRPATGAHRLR